MKKKFLFKATVLLSIIVSILYGIYNSYIREEGEIIIIYPDTSPTKIKPQESGGIIIANANNAIYENLQKKKNSKQVVLQPEPEKPLNILTPKVVENEKFDSIEEIMDSIEGQDKTSNKSCNKDKDKEEDLDILYQDLMGEKKSSASTTKAPVSKDNLPQVGLNIIKVTEKRQGPNDKQLLNHTKRNYYKIQFASVKTELVANQELERIKKKYAKIFNKIPLTVRKMRSEKGNFFYSVMAGNYEDIRQAKALCKKLDSYQECLIINH